MGEIRIKAKRGVYHLFGRVIHKQHLLSELDREVWVAALGRVARFSGVEVITYCAMKNHFHILARIDEAAREVDDAELVERYGALYGESVAQWSGLDAAGLAEVFREGPAVRAEFLRNRLKARMGDVSEFMRTLRMRYTKWFNQKHGAVGTLWAERFGSVLLEDTPWLVGMVAAYVDLNPVRAGLTDLPEDYRWCGYAAALAGDRELRRQLARCFPGKGTEAFALARYRLFLMGMGAKGKADGSGERVSREALLKTLASGGMLRPDEIVRLKLRFMAKGVVLGSQAFINGSELLEMLKQLPWQKPPLPVTPGPGGGLYCARPRMHGPPYEKPAVDETS